MCSFTDLTNAVYKINDMILADMMCVTEDYSEAVLDFSKHLLAMKYWFVRISWANKKRFILALLDDVRSAWALSLILKSIWNSRVKCAVMSVNEKIHWSSYDQVPMDHNRTALPVSTLIHVMTEDRKWFLSLDPECQAMVLTDLLTVSGGPIIWAVLRRGEHIYEQYQQDMLHNLRECYVVPSVPNGKTSPEKIPLPEDTKKKGKPLEKDTNVNALDEAQKELEKNLAMWNSTIKSMRDSLKLEELEMRFVDGTKRKMWKVNRPKPGVLETVDFVQLLPSSIAKRILSHLPPEMLGECSKVNKYWTYLVEEYKAEKHAKVKIQADFEKLQGLMLGHDTSLESICFNTGVAVIPGSAFGAEPYVNPKVTPSVRPSERSTGAYSFRQMIADSLARPCIPRKQKPVRNMAELSERLEQRGATDENLWMWCGNMMKLAKKRKMKVTQKGVEGVLHLGHMHFPCPLMTSDVEIPLQQPLEKDPTKTAPLKCKRNISNAVLRPPSAEAVTKHYNLWTKNVSGLYPVYKIPSHQSPF